MGDAMWLVVAGVAAGVLGGLGWWLFKRSRPPVDEAEPPVAPTAVTAAETAPHVARVVPAPTLPVAVVPAAAVPPTLPPVAPPPVAQTPTRPAPPPAAPPPKFAPAAPPAVAAAPAQAPQRVADRPALPALPKVARFELRDARDAVLLLERAPAAAWSGARALVSTPVQREQLSGLVARAAELDGSAEGDPVYAVHLAAGVALTLARSEGAVSGASPFVSAPSLALAPDAAANFAAAALALQAARVHLPDLRAQVGEAKTVVAALHPKLIASTEGRLKSLAQDLARYLREVEENYAGAIRKPVFIARVDAACEQAAAVWQKALAATTAARSQLETQAQAPRFGEVQLEKSLAALRELQGQRRVLDAAARLLSGWEQLRLLLGDAAPGAASLLRDAAAALATAREADGHIGATVKACIDAAKAPDYVGKAEFIAHRNAARELLPTLETGVLATAQAALARAGAALAAGFAGRAAQALLLRVDAAARVVEVREPAESGEPS